MPITPQFSYRDIEAEIEKQLEAKKKAILNTLVYVGKMCVNHARDSSRRRYKDQTGNLTSSIGYVVLNDGVVFSQSAFPTVKEGKKGKSIGRDYIKSLIAKNQNGMVLIVVAGMNYATYVEALGLDVLISAELVAEKKVPELLRKLGLKL